MEEISAGLDLLKQMYDKAGLLGGVVAGVVLVIRLYRASWIQALIPGKLKWDKQPEWTKKVIVCLVALLGSVAAAVLGGMAWLPALVSAIPVALGAIVTHETTKAVGSVADAKIVEYKSSGKDPNYEPSPYRKAASYMFPIDWTKIPNNPKYKPPIGIIK